LSAALVNTRIVTVILADEWDIEQANAGLAILVLER
jgi:hypothetical protein